ncbi:hypothetical protein [Polaromonas sp. DSR2-3-2]|uniref:hypothetical protein n=1 Tax=unclassified Polaromonas TaxID=2638319 RepID=UPI003CEB6A6C
MAPLDKPQSKRIDCMDLPHRLAKPLEFFQAANIVMLSGLAGTRAGQKACLAHRPMRQRATGPALLTQDVFHQRKARRDTS